ncbi:MAG: 50S ribosomal protein L3, partial [Candidatus Diapherotrites archaeon]|nr:50S ribosomal protein L3 [Candidatus Diapherotrites archaeon]
EYVDIKGATKGKGMQGPVKRFGVHKQKRKPDKTRIVGSIGAWTPSAVMWTVGRPGQMGYHIRTEYNKKVLITGETGEKINPSGGFLHYGTVKGSFVVLAGSVAGPANRVLGLRKAIRPPKKETVALSEITMISTSSKQGN